MDRIRILIVDDHSLFAETLGIRLGSEPDLTVPAIADRADGLLGLIEAEQPDLMLLDYRLGEVDGIDVLGEVHSRFPKLAVLMLSAHSQPSVVVDALRAGARGWVPKSMEALELIRIIRLVAAGGRWIPEDMLGPVLAILLDDDDPPPNVLARLTERERQVLQCTMDGKSRADIAAELFVSANTVRTHTQNLLGKLECHSLLEAVALARRNGMRPSRSAEESVVAKPADS